MNLPGPSIPTSEAVECLDCRVIFSGREVACPKCGSVLGLVPVETTAPASEIARLKDREAWVVAALMQIAHGSHGADFKANAAKHALASLQYDDGRQRGTVDPRFPAPKETIQ